MDRKQALQIYSQLNAAIEKARLLLPDNAKTTIKVQRHKYGGMEEIGCLDHCPNEHWEQVEETVYPALQPFNDLLESLKREATE